MTPGRMSYPEEHCAQIAGLSTYHVRHRLDVDRVRGEDCGSEQADRRRRIVVAVEFPADKVEEHRSYRV